MSRLGRNPFDKKKTAAATEEKRPLRALDVMHEIPMPEATLKPHRAVKSSRTHFGELAEFLMVDLRAESYLLGLKIYLLSMALFE